MANPLRNLIAKLAAGKPVAIGYFGGSITEGAGASDGNKTSWRPLVTTWLHARYPANQMREINAAIGGTGSDLGAFRVAQDLLRQKPDLVFVEYAVNDGGTPPDRAARGVESIVRQCWMADPEIDIVFVYTTTKGLADAYEHGKMPTTIEAEQRVADHYGIPTVNVGKPLWQKIHDGGGTWETLTKDGVHPNDQGYVIYASAVEEFLAPLLAQPGKTARRELPAPLDARSMTCGKLVDAWEATANGWAKEDKSLAGRFPHMLTANAAGSKLTFAFTGTNIGLYWLISPDAGDLEWSIDGGPAKRASSWDHYALQFSRANYVVLDDHLDNKPHQLAITVLGEKNEKSTGTWIRIGAFLVGN